MKIGKLTNEELNKVVLDKLHISRKEVLIGSGIGVDCAALDLGGEYCVLSTDPITAAEAGAGALAVHISANDIAASGGEPFAMLVTILLPPQYDLVQLGAMMEEIYREANRLHIDVVGGHTEVTDAVNKAVISVAAIGKTKKILRYEDARPGDKLILTKQCGIEGGIILCKDHPEAAEAFLDTSEKALLPEMEQQLSVVKEARIAAQMGAIAMHDITEGGVFGATYEMAEAAGLGLCINEAAIAVHPVAQKACAHFDLNPYRLISSGSLLVIWHGDEQPLLQALKDEGIFAACIGEFTQGEICTVESGILMPPTQDELFKIKK